MKVSRVYLCMWINFIHNHIFFTLVLHFLTTYGTSTSLYKTKIFGDEPDLTSDFYMHNRTKKKKHTLGFQMEPKCISWAATKCANWFSAHTISQPRVFIADVQKMNIFASRFCVLCMTHTQMLLRSLSRNRAEQLTNYGSGRSVFAVVDCSNKPMAIRILRSLRLRPFIHFESSHSTFFSLGHTTLLSHFDIDI